jgi:hypothetical protein
MAGNDGALSPGSRAPSFLSFDGPILRSGGEWCPKHVGSRCKTVSTTYIRDGASIPGDSLPRTSIRHAPARVGKALAKGEPIRLMEINSVPHPVLDPRAAASLRHCPENVQVHPDHHMAREVLGIAFIAVLCP